MPLYVRITTAHISQIATICGAHCGIHCGAWVQLCSQHTSIVVAVELYHAVASVAYTLKSKELVVDVDVG